MFQPGPSHSKNISAASRYRSCVVSTFSLGMTEDSEDLLSLEELIYTTNGTAELDFGEGGEHLRTFTLYLGKESQI